MYIVHSFCGPCKERRNSLISIGINVIFRFFVVCGNLLTHAIQIWLENGFVGADSCKKCPVNWKLYQIVLHCIEYPWRFEMQPISSAFAQRDGWIYAWFSRQWQKKMFSLAENAQLSEDSLLNIWCGNKKDPQWKKIRQEIIIGCKTKWSGGKMEREEKQ